MYSPQMLADYIEQLCDTFRDAICVTDRSGVVVLVNKRHAELTGLPRERMIGRNIQDMVQNGVFDVVLNPRVVESGEKVSSVQNVFNGRTLLLDGHPVKDAAGTVVLVVTVIRDITALTELREEIANQRELLETFQNLNAEGVTGNQYPRVVRSQTMQRLYAEAAGIAETDATVLLLGETGVGKDVVARHIHSVSRRAEAPFVKVDCGSIPENLIETELFGYVPGSFSGASKNGKAGLVEAASGGTLFLDEIGELPMTMQSRLLRVLQDWEVLRVGATAPKKVDVRVIAATNKDLEHEVARGAFRSDLYYRLKVAVLHIPPLRSRKVDILPLAQSFLTYYGRKYRKSMQFSREAETILEEYAWPGNVRELENLVQGLVVTCRQGVIEARDMAGIRPRVRSESGGEGYELPSAEGRSLKSVMKEVENSILRAGLKRYGSISELSRQFQMDRSTIFRKVKELEASQRG
ncbi:sigma 54-interacting transcriptional regulator [uncultured Desulfovibrio sp.]|uniref:sigma-54 interaction domain-containing protein n=1 Tax=uncultured Desulfovibrio sp. TaxID=167968 RepID=UPI00262AC6F2|nr:sigma 54-interacting transcriptional regulator [uncultured Desulfovibrio sp.]